MTDGTALREIAAEILTEILENSTPAAFLRSFPEP